MFAKYIIRLDDASPFMSRNKWDRMELLLDKYNIKPMVAIIPNNQDEKLILDEYDEKFWDKASSWQDKGWEIALHGYNHKYISKERSIVPINDYSEFAGLSLEKQKIKIQQGIKVFKEHSLTCRLWIAPAHSFDENTILALQSESEIDTISDGIAFSLFWQHGMFWIPQQLWRARKMPFGLWTICYHPEMMSEKEFNALELFLEENSKNVTTLNSITLKKREKNIFEKIFEILYWKILERKKSSR